ncbi:hypothetical protein TURU_011361 [Turdus rufiventris]|nr:hypothetical protein TURU_011361 [Turdus rufiventris]
MNFLTGMHTVRKSCPRKKPGATKSTGTCKSALAKGFLKSKAPLARRAERRPSVQPSWGDGSGQGLVQDSWEQDTIQSLRFKALVREEDEWDEVSILELHEEEGEARQQRMADLE